MTATSDELKAVRAKSGLTQKEAAALAGVTLKTWQNWEQGKSPVRTSALLLFCKLTRQAAPASVMSARPKPRRKKRQSAG
jgi:DNA-binding transcriptional regulator YiaG